jgi:hypothetical protein
MCETVVQRVGSWCPVHKVRSSVLLVGDFFRTAFLTTTKAFHPYKFIPYVIEDFKLF